MYKIKAITLYYLVVETNRSVDPTMRFAYITFNSFNFNQESFVISHILNESDWSNTKVCLYSSKF